MMIGYVVIAAGTALAFVSAVVPHYTAGYQFLFGVMVAGITPYFIYALSVVLLRRRMTKVVGVVLLTLHAGLVISERFVGGAKYSDRTIYLASMLFVVLLIPLLVRALREPWHE